MEGAELAPAPLSMTFIAAPALGQGQPAPVATTIAGNIWL